jgi:RimJ/RimL family protein N-acetyltransferase
MRRYAEGPPILETARLRLRPHTLDDVDASHRMNLDAEVSRFTHDGGVVDRSEVERRIRENVLGDYARYGFGRLVVERKDTGAFIGFCGLKWLEDLGEVDLGYRLMRAHWGQGYATEASRACVEWGFLELGLERIIALVLPENMASIRVLEKLGFVHAHDMEEAGVRAMCFALVKVRP